MSVSGNWTLFFDWNCDGDYSTAPMTVNNDGTFTTQNYTGLWTQVAGIFMFQFDSSKTTYAGNLAGKSITGIMSTFAGDNLKGCFYMLRSDAEISRAAKRVQDKPDVSGK